MGYQCRHCHAPNAKMVCSRCKVARYCTSACQRSGWVCATAGHKCECKKLTRAAAQVTHWSMTKLLGSLSMRLMTGQNPSNVPFVVLLSKMRECLVQHYGSHARPPLTSCLVELMCSDPVHPYDMRPIDPNELGLRLHEIGSDDSARATLREDSDATAWMMNQRLVHCAHVLLLAQCSRTHMSGWPRLRRKKPLNSLDRASSIWMQNGRR